MLEANLNSFYDLIHRQAEKTGLHRLADCHGRMPWPKRGVYFFFEDGETRRDGSPRIVRVGTHVGKTTTLWKRLYTHRGTRCGFGYHRGSVFREHAGRAMIARDYKDSRAAKTWGSKSRPTEAGSRDAEKIIELAISEYLGRMHFVVLSVDEPSDTNTGRRIIEQQSPGLLSAGLANGIESASSNWLGRWSPHPVIQKSGLWNVDHVGGEYEACFLDAIAAQGGSA